MLATKNDLTIAALIRGIRDPERAQAYIDAEIELADDEARDVRKEIIGACNRKKTALEGDDTDANDADVDTGTDTAPDKDDDTAAHNRHDGDDSDGVRRGETVAVDDGEPYPNVDRFEDDDALQAAVENHDHDDVFTTAKKGGTVAGCFKCESHIGFVPKERDD